MLGSSAGYVKYGLDPQEAALREGLRPGEDRAELGRGAGVRLRPARLRRVAADRWRRAGADPRRATTPRTTPPIERALREGGQPPVTATEAAAALRVLEAAKLSAAEGRTVRIEAAA